MRRARISPAREFSPTEAAFVTGLSVKAINQAIDRQEITPLRTPGAKNIRRIGMAEIIYLCLRVKTMGPLSKEGHKLIYAALRQYELQGDPLPDPLKIDLTSGTSISVNDPLPSAAADRLTSLERSLTHVVSDPDICGGRPTVRNTRVPVHTVYEIKQLGASDAELLEDFPSLTPETLDAALAYAAAYPPRGRPNSVVPWHDPSGPWRRVL
jgi:uncharacterized protein (DUF433 family)